MSNRSVLLILTSHSDLAGIRQTGYYVGEAAHPWAEFVKAGYTVDVASIAGGVPPQDGIDDSDPLQAEFLHDPRIAEQLKNTRAVSEISASDYDAIYLVGGHGTMWDMPTSTALAELGRAVYEQGGIVSAVCHGPAGLVGMTTSDGTPLVFGKAVTGFSNTEEDAAGLSTTVPFLLESALSTLGAHYRSAADFTEHVVVDSRLITGQNPQSAAGVARAVIAELSA